MLEKLAASHGQLNTDSKAKVPSTESSANWILFWREMKTSPKIFVGEVRPTAIRENTYYVNVIGI